MNKILEYLRLIFIIAGVLIGIQAPGFVDQYGKALQAHYFESQISLKEFQDDADKFFGGSLNRLAEHYRNNPDPVIFEGGISLAALIARNDQLSMAYNAFHKNPYSPYIQVVFFPVADIKNEVFESYTYTVVLNQAAVLVGLLSALIIAVMFELVTVFIRLSARSLHKKLRPPQKVSG